MPMKYELVENPEGFHTDHWCIEIKEGSLEGVVYQYDTVKFESDSPDADEVEIRFNTITVSNPNNIDLTTKESVGIMGDILVELIRDNLKETTDAQDRTNDTKTSG
jgi:hypothetical protein